MSLVLRGVWRVLVRTGPPSRPLAGGHGLGIVGVLLLSQLLVLRLLLLLIKLLNRLNLLLQLHPPVLEPDLDLSLGETQSVRHLYSSSAGQVVVGVELLLQLERLVPRVGLPSPAPQSVGSCRREKQMLVEVL